MSNQDQKKQKTNWVSVNADDQHFTLFLLFMGVLATSIKAPVGEVFMPWRKEIISHSWFG